MDKKRTAFANRICNEKSYLQMELLSDLHIAFPQTECEAGSRIGGYMEAQGSPCGNMR